MLRGVPRLPRGEHGPEYCCEDRRTEDPGVVSEPFSKAQGPCRVPTDCSVIVTSDRTCTAARVCRVTTVA
jgi:hypothetical protein